MSAPHRHGMTVVAAAPAGGTPAGQARQETPPRAAGNAIRFGRAPGG